jgi:putative aldouronate transport system permease protein
MALPTQDGVALSAARPGSSLGRTWRRIRRHKLLYLLVLPALIYYAIFSYAPMYGLTLAFKQYMFREGILGSPWVGWSNFQEAFLYNDFWNALRNTVIISFGRLIFEFPVAIILALLLNELGERSKAKRLFQTVFTFPHFLSWVVLSGILINILGDTGLVNAIFSQIGLSRTDFLVTPSTFRPLLFASDDWKETGWAAIIYLAAIAGISPEQYEAAYVDGANRFDQLRFITLPAIAGTISIMLILAIGNIMNAGFDQIFNLYSGAVLNVGDILDTFVYRYTFQQGGSYGVATAVGLFKSVLNLVLLLLANGVVKRMGQEGLF